MRTLHKPERYENLKEEMKAMQLDILGIAETRWTADGSISDGEYEMVYSGGEQHQHGVGIMMEREIANCLLGYWPITERLIMMKIQGAPLNISIIQVYAPTSDHSDEGVQKFYESIKETMKYTKSGEVIIIMGDWNAKVGDEHE